MALGLAGTTAWALMITVTNEKPSPIPYENPPVHFEAEEQCRMVERAINGKVAQAGVGDRIQAKCSQIEFIDMPSFHKNPGIPG